MVSVTFTHDLDSGIPVHVLNSLFKDRTTSYKYFFFLALLDWFDGSVNTTWRGFEDLAIPLRWLSHRMAVHAWDPVVYFGLSLGSSDRLSIPLIGIRDRMTGEGTRFSLRPEKAIAMYATAEFRTQLATITNRYVSYRLLRPFFAEKLSGLPDSKINRAISEATQADRNERAPYSIGSGAKEIVVRPAWAVFIVRNLGLLRDWTRGHLVEYLTSKNPLAPSVAAKLQRVSSASLTQQRKFVTWLITQNRINPICSYTGLRFRKDDLVLDHFLPRALVAHDEIWNLVPIHRAVNTQKSAAIPDSQLIERVTDVEFAYYSALPAFMETGALRSSQRFSNEIATALGISADPTSVSRTDFNESYRRAVTPWIEIAPTYGFSSGWLPPDRFSSSS